MYRQPPATRHSGNPADTGANGEPLVGREAVKGGKVVARLLGAADELARFPIRTHQHLGSGPAVVVVAHREPVRARIVDDEQVALLPLRAGAGR